MENQAAKQIGIAVVAQAGRYLVGVRGPEQVLAGCAEFPGGKCHSSESPAAAAVRECREETGLTVTADHLLDTVRFSYPHGDVELHFWLCRPVDAAQIAPDHHGFRWVTRQELGTLPFPEANRPVIARLVSE